MNFGPAVALDAAGAASEASLEAASGPSARRSTLQTTLGLVVPGARRATLQSALGLAAVTDAGEGGGANEPKKVTEGGTAIGTELATQGDSRSGML